MFRKIYRLHVNRIKKNIYKAKMKRYELSKSRSNSTNIIIGHPVAIGGAMYGKALGEGIRRMRSMGFRESVKLLFWSMYGPTTYIISMILTLFVIGFFVGLLRLIAGIDLLSSDPWAMFMMLIFFGVPAIPNLHGRYLARSDVKTTKRLQNSVGDASIDQIDEALQHIDHNHYQTRIAAAKVLATIIKGSPGKAVKYSSSDPESICEILIKQLQSDDGDMQELSIRCLSWMSRDYGQALHPYPKLFANFVQSDHTPLQVHSITILGNIGATDPDRRPAYVRAIKPGVTDPDADVRTAAANALGKLPCDPALGLLEELIQDTDPDVRQRASATVQQLAA